MACLVKRYLFIMDLHAVRFHISILKSHAHQPRTHPVPRTLPAGSYGQLQVDLRGVDGPVICHQVRVIGHTIHIQSHHWEINADDVIMPLLITDLRERERSSQYFCFLYICCFHLCFNVLFQHNLYTVLVFYYYYYDL